MRARVQKWGNSLAVRIPKAFAEEMHIGPEAPVELSLVEGALVVSPATGSEPTLAELLAGVTESNLHREVDMGPPVGHEIW